MGVVSLRDLVRAWTRERTWRRTIQIRHAMTADRSFQRYWALARFDRFPRMMRFSG